MAILHIFAILQYLGDFIFCNGQIDVKMSL